MGRKLSGEGFVTGAQLAALAKAVGEGPLVFLTGAGVSAESGIPTFRGEEGYWRADGRNYHPMELATREAFSKVPDTSWAWYLYRRAVCRGAQPNPAHEALARLERAIGNRYVLVTQNVDGLHLRAGNTLARTHQVHGNIDFMRCWNDCTLEAYPLPPGLETFSQDDVVGDRERALLRCPHCGGRARPHILWFDESYDEVRYRFETSIRAARSCAAIVIVGTSGATTLPNHMAEIAARRDVPFLAINPEPSPFTELALRLPNGLYVESTAGATVPALCDALAST
jgi:NAD-dependent deacetylase